MNSETQIRIGIIDDDKVYRVLASKIIATVSFPFELQHFDGAEEAISALKFSKPDKWPHILFLDLSMPAMDGWDFLDAVQSTLPELLEKVQIYIVSSSNNSLDRERAMEYPFLKGYLVKPILQSTYLELFQNLPFVKSDPK